MQKELYKFLKSNTDSAKNYGCKNCRENLVILLRLIKKRQNFSFKVNKDFSGNYLHIDNVKKEKAFLENWKN